MKPEPANATVRPVLWIARLAGSLALMAGTAALAGWALDIDGLKSLRPGWVTVKPNTAIGLVLTGIATLLASGSRSVQAAAARFGRICALLAGGIGIFSLVEYAFDWDSGFDQWLFPDPVGAVGTSHLGRMAPETALCFVLVAAALRAPQGLRSSRRWRACSWRPSHWPRCSAISRLRWARSAGGVSPSWPCRPR